MPVVQARHAAEDVLPVDGLRVPATHGVQDDWPFLLYVPGSQTRHAADDVLPVDGLYVPAAQGVHND